MAAVVEALCPEPCTHVRASQLLGWCTSSIPRFLSAPLHSNYNAGALGSVANTFSHCLHLSCAIYHLPQVLTGLRREMEAPRNRRTPKPPKRSLF